MPRRQTSQKPDPKEQLRAAVKRLVGRTGGLSLIALALLGLFSIASFSISDPSLSNATGREAVANVGGPVGAILSDILLQGLGGAGLALFFVVLLWGVDAVLYGTPEKTPLSAYLKAGALPLGLVFFAANLAAWPRAADWPFIVGMGGLFGDGLLGALAGGLAAVAVPFPRMVSATLFGSGAVVLLSFAAGARWAHLFESVVSICHRRRPHRANPSSTWNSAASRRRARWCGTTSPRGPT